MYRAAVERISAIMFGAFQGVPYSPRSCRRRDGNRCHRGLRRPLFKGGQKIQANTFPQRRPRLPGAALMATVLPEIRADLVNSGLFSSTTPGRACS